MRNGWRLLSEASGAGYTCYDDTDAKNQPRVLLWVRGEGPSFGVIVERPDGLHPMVDYLYGQKPKVDAWQPAPLGPRSGVRRKK